MYMNPWDSKKYNAVMTQNSSLDYNVYCDMNFNTCEFQVSREEDIISVRL